SLRARTTAMSATAKTPRSRAHRKAERAFVASRNRRILRRCDSRVGAETGTAKGFVGCSPVLDRFVGQCIVSADSRRVPGEFNQERGQKMTIRSCFSKAVRSNRISLVQAREGCPNGAARHRNCELQAGVHRVQTPTAPQS